MWLRLDGASTFAQGIVSRDALGTLTAGHITLMRTCDDRLAIRLQTLQETNHVRCTSQLVPTGTWVHVGVNFGAPDLALFVDGQLADFVGDISTLGDDCSSTWTCGGAQTTLGIVGNTIPWTLGVSQKLSDEGDITPQEGFFEGAIDSFRISRIQRIFP